MTQAEKVVKIALNEVGKNAGGDKFWSWYGFKSRVSWCACFVSWVLDQAGVPCLDLRPLISAAGSAEEAEAIKTAAQDPDVVGIISKGCVQILEFFQQAGRRIGDEPAQPGDIVLYEWDEGAGDGVDHVGIVEYVDGTDPDTQILHMIEGNWGNQVCRTKYRYRDKRVYAICRPRYTEAEEIEAPFDLQTGDKGRDVQLLQMALLMHGYDVGPDDMDGDFGADTDAAVRLFQADHGLDADGIAGTDTWTEICGKNC